MGDQCQHITAGSAAGVDEEVGMQARDFRLADTGALEAAAVDQGAGMVSGEGS